MKTINSILCLLVTALAAPAAAEPTFIQRSRTSSESANAGITVIAPDYSSATYLNLDLRATTTTADLTQDSGTPPISFSSTSLSLTAQIYAADGSTESLNGAAELPAGSYSLSNSAASVSGVPVTLYGYRYGADGTYSFVSRTVIVTASWAAMSTFSRDSATCTSGGGYRAQSRSSSMTYDASFSGAILDEAGSDLIATGDVIAGIGSGLSASYVAF